MNVVDLLKHYERIADAPDAVARLRRFLLDLAVRGKLVSQDELEGSALTLLGQIATVTGKQATIRNEREQFVLPHSWQWSSLGQITTKTGSGSTPRGGKEVYKPTGIPFLRSQNVHDDGLRLDDVVRIDAATHERMRSTAVIPGDLLLNITGGSIGRCCRVAAESIVANISQHVAIIRMAVPDMGPYAHVVVRSPYFQTFVIDEQTGAGRGGLPKNRMDRILVPIPPLAEQRRIVAKVAELMALCDQLEAARRKREATRDRLAAASLARLNAPDPKNFQTDTGFALRVLPLLSVRSDQIKQVRQTILNLAARGMLLAQDRSEEPASVLLKRVSEEREQLINKRQVRRETPLAQINETETPFALPAGWVWARIGDAVLSTQYGTSQKAHSSESGVAVLTMGNIQDGLVLSKNEKRIPKSSEELPALYLNRQDLLFNRTNSAELVGKTGIFLGDSLTTTFASYLICIRPSSEWTSPRFINIAMNAPQFRSTQIAPLIKQQTGQANVNGTSLKNMLIPLPPLPEQHRIVAKVDELMAVCDQLEARLTSSAEARRRLLDALLHEALTPERDIAA